MIAKHLLQQAHHVITQRDGRRKLPLDIARERKRSRIVRLLTEDQTQSAVSTGFSGRGRGRGHGLSSGPPGLVQTPEVPSQEIPGKETLKFLLFYSHGCQSCKSYGCRSPNATIVYFRVLSVSDTHFCQS